MKRSACRSHACAVGRLCSPRRGGSDPSTGKKGLDVLCEGSGKRDCLAKNDRMGDVQIRIKKADDELTTSDR